jgi:DNA repair protein RadA
MMSRDGGALKSLQNVDEQLISRLEGAGIQSISDLATTTPYELLEDYHSNYDDVIEGIDFETISQLVLKARQRLIEQGLLQRDFYSAEKMLEIREKQIRFTTGSQSFDLFLGGGIETQALTEVVGEFGSGKSQLCYTLCVTANMSDKDSGIIFVRTY